MANPNRAMATMRRIDSVTPIEGADRIECAHVGGWSVVVGKGEFKRGDLCVYFEIDTFMPEGDERYEFLQGEHQKVMLVDGVPKRGHVLRTVRLRGQYSQGLLMRPEKALPSDIPEHAYEQMCEHRANISGLCGVCEYVPTVPLNASFVGKYDPFVAPRTDAERIQNVDQATWDLVRRTDYEVSVKVDGTSVTMLYDDRVNRIRMFSHNNEFDLDAQGTAKVAYDAAKAQGLVGFCERNHMVTLQAELCGPKIQSDRLGLGKHRLFVFSVWDVMACEYVSRGGISRFDGHEAVLDSFVPIVSPGEPFVNTGRTLESYDTPQKMLEGVDGLRGAVTKNRLDEGLVVHIFGSGDLTNDEWMLLKSELGPTMQIKAVSNRYLLKAKE